MDAETPYADLDPATVLDAVEAAGIPSSGHSLALNSYENRVYQVGVEDARPVVVKFYRPGRWSDAAILDEHGFSLELADADVPVVAPMIVDGETLLRVKGYRYAVYPSVGGRWPELATTEDRAMLGRFLGRLHAVGRRRPLHGHQRRGGTAGAGGEQAGNRKQRRDYTKASHAGILPHPAPVVTTAARS